jgi:DNA repair protein RecN (Recombination protein N)
VLEELRITGLGVIDDTTLPLTGGMNVITGETGAGKTMVVTGLGLLFGGRADAGRVRADPGRAVVEGRLRLIGPTATAVQARIADAGAEPDDDGTVLLSRTVTVEGRSRAHVGGRGAPVSVLADVGEQVVAVHGQSDQLRLLRPAEQRAALDRFAGPEHETLLETYREAYSRWRAVVDDLADRRRHARERTQEA